MHYIKDQQLKEKGHIMKDFPLPSSFIQALKDNNFQKLDELMSYHCQRGGNLFEELQKYANFNSIEHIIAIRRSENDEEGIWHCDGSRNLAFTWSLNENPKAIEGGQLFFRKKGNKDSLEFSPPPLGTLIIFLTGIDGYEHRVGKVNKGCRHTFAGWCSL